MRVAIALSRGLVRRLPTTKGLKGFLSTNCAMIFLTCGHLSEHSRTSFEKNCFSAWASTLNMGLINKVDMVCLSPVGYGV